VPSGVKFTICMTPGPTGVVSVTGSPSARVLLTRSSFSQRETPSGSVEMMISS